MTDFHVEEVMVMVEAVFQYPILTSTMSENMTIVSMKMMRMHTKIRAQTIHLLDLWVSGYPNCRKHLPWIHFED